jgi:hypothetical protein
LERRRSRPAALLLLARKDVSIYVVRSVSWLPVAPR